MRLGLYIHTLRHLRPRQIQAQVWKKLRSWLGESLTTAAAPPVPEWAEGNVSALRPPVPLQDAGKIRGGSLDFVEERRDLGWPPDWSAKGASKLWQYNLHYHDWLWSMLEEDEWDAGVAGVRSWIESNPPGGGWVAWDSYPISIRLQNWVLLLFHRNRERLEQDKDLRGLLWQSLWAQGCRLEGRLEIHLLGNHLFENAVTLCLLGATFRGEDGERWRRNGLELLRRELAEQLPGDGMHFELSPMYHLRVTWLLDVLAVVGDEEIGELVEGYRTRADEALSHLRHPDGGLALLNDSALGIYADKDQGEARLGAWSLPDAGYYGFRSAGGDYLVCDAGKIGPDYIPGHAHADCLSFELSLRGERVITDTGVSDYEVSETRAVVRSTAAHNTVEIDGQDQAEMWGAFRVARRGYPESVRWEPRDDGFRLEAAHTGYLRLRSKVRHARSFELSPGLLTIEDRVEGRGSYTAVSRLHFAPGVQVSEVDGALVGKTANGGFEIRFEGQGAIKIAKSPSYAKFGMAESRSVVEFHVTADGEESWKTVIMWSRD